MGRSTSSSQRGAGGINSSGNPLDTIICIPGAGKKAILSLSWAFSSLGGAVNTGQMLTSRIAVVDGVDLTTTLSSGSNIAVGMSAGTLDPLLAVAGRILFDTQVLGGITDNGVYGLTSQPISGQFHFPSEATEGRLESSSGPLSIIMTAPVTSITHAAPSNIQGILTVQYAMDYDATPARGYAFPHYSGPVSR